MGNGSVAKCPGSAFKWFKEEFCNSANETAIGLKESVYDTLTRIADRSSRAAKWSFFPYLVGAVTTKSESECQRYVY